MVVDIATPTTDQAHLRRLDMRKDLAKVADLVELCFYDTLDPDGKQYLKEMRRAAQNVSWISWASNLIDEAPMPPSGYVWEEDGRLVGTLSLIPILVHGKKGYMIANVATHPDYRGRGIASALTITALKHARQHQAACAWLQVRDNNLSAIHIYENNGFKERIRRSSWFSGPIIPDQPTPGGIKVVHRQASHWRMQREWLNRLYPAEFTWHVPIDWNLFRPDLLGKFIRTFSLEFLHHWSVERNGHLEGVLSWKHASGFSDPLWLAIPESYDNSSILSLISQARRHIRRDQPLNLNFPDGVAANVLQESGFYLHQTLIWMEHSF